VTITPIETLSGDKQSKVVIKGLKIPEARRLGEAHQGKDRITRLLDMATVLKCAEMEGGAQAGPRHDSSVPQGESPVREAHRRSGSPPDPCRQYGRRPGRHEVRYLSRAWKVNDKQPFAKDVAMAKAWCSEAYRRICDLAHQCHGAIGFCEDHDLPLYSKRSKVSEFAFGDAQFQRRLVAKEIGL